MVADDKRKWKFPTLAALSMTLWVVTLITFSRLSLHQYDTCHLKDSFVQSTSEKPKDKESPLPQIAWLMSWPNSGTSYTLRLIRQISNLTTATNYGHEHLFNDSSILINQEWTNGPFRANISQQLPQHFVLTKTHCGSRCVHCAPDGYLETPRTFQRACLTGRRYYNSSSSQQVMYDPSIVTRAVHLIRNPMDNVVSRFHLSRRHAGDRALDNNATGFHAWCTKMDTSFTLYETHTPWLDPPLLKLWRDVPCHAEFFKYMQWHNMAWITTQSLGIPVHWLRYEDYHNNWKGTTEALSYFLDLPISTWEDATVFEIQTYDSSYYSLTQKLAIEALLQNLASAPMWEMVRPYFRPLQGES